MGCNPLVDGEINLVGCNHCFLKTWNGIKKQTIQQLCVYEGKSFSLTYLHIYTYVHVCILVQCQVYFLLQVNQKAQKAHLGSSFLPTWDVRSWTLGLVTRSLP